MEKREKEEKEKEKVGMKVKGWKTVVQQEERTRLDTQGKHLYIGIDSLSTHLPDFLSLSLFFSWRVMLTLLSKFGFKSLSPYNIKRLPFEITFDWMVVRVIVLGLFFLFSSFPFLSHIVCLLPFFILPSIDSTSFFSHDLQFPCNINFFSYVTKRES